MIEYWINKLEFKNGKTVDLKENSIVVFVGPNNSGKSLTLKEISQLTSRNVLENNIVDSLAITAKGDSSCFLEVIQNREKNGNYHFLDDHHSAINVTTLSTNWDSLVNGTQIAKSSISPFLVKNMNTINRLNLVSPPANIDFLNELRTH